MSVETAGRIQILPDTVANQIAAGEVVERPAAVVKELVENSLDAGATQVRVRFAGAGKQLIEVEDDGCGMNPDEALLALERHATSKLRVASDLNEVRTLGFRGEALPSIASVSRFTLKTRARDWPEGSEVRVNAGKLLEQRACGMAVGTRITVAHLFQAVPARRKFLRTDATETAHIVQLLRLYAVAHPRVAFTLEEGSRVVFRSPACPRLADRVAEIWGRALAEELVALDAPPEGDAPQPPYRLEGLVGRPGRGRSTRQELITIVNGRPVDCRALNYAVIEAYEGLIPKGRYPAGFLFLACPPEGVDVNVHPAKREVRFREEGRIRAFVRSVLQECLESILELGARPPSAIGGASMSTQPAPPSSVEAAPVRRVSEGLEAERGSRTAAEGVAVFDAPKRALADRSGPAYPKARGPRWQGPPVRASGVARGADEDLAGEAAPLAEAGARDWRWLGLLEVLPGCGLFETADGLVVLNAGAARRRIAYERVLQTRAQEAVPRQALLLPVPLEFSPTEAAAVDGFQSFLAGAGFELEAFGRNFYRLRAVPGWLEAEAAEAVVRDLVGALREGRISDADTQRGQAAAWEALARVAVQRMSGETPRTAAAFGELRTALFRCGQPLVDPTGKPTLFELNRRELARRLGRA
ncbi:MAG: DNA mismatch repair endonuclease MutL [Opitutales bacterium]